MQKRKKVQKILHINLSPFEAKLWKNLTKNKFNEQSSYGTRYNHNEIDNKIPIYSALAKPSEPFFFFSNIM